MLVVAHTSGRRGSACYPRAVRGYVATVVGGLVGFCASYVLLGHLLGRVFMWSAENWCPERDPACAADKALVLLAVATSPVVVPLASGLAVTLSLAMARAHARKETALSAVVATGLLMALLLQSIVTDGMPDDVVDRMLENIPEAVWLLIVAFMLFGAHWVGLRWHRWRSVVAPDHQQDR